MWTHALCRKDDGMRTTGLHHRAMRLLQRFHLSREASRPGAHQQHLQSERELVGIAFRTWRSRHYRWDRYAPKSSSPEFGS